TKSEYTAVMPSESEEIAQLSPLEQACVEFVRDVRRLGKTDPRSPEALDLLRRIHERRAALPGLIVVDIPLKPSAAELRSAFPAEAAGTPPGKIDLQASADDEPLVRKPPVRAMKWRGEVAQGKFIGKTMSINLPIAVLLTDCLPFDNIVITPK